MTTLKALKNDVNIVFDELNVYTENIKTVLEKTKIIIGNDLGSCKRDGCTVDKPCAVCRSLRQLDEEIDVFLE